MKTKNLIWPLLCCLLTIHGTVVSSQAQNCEEVFFNRLEQTFHRKKPRFIKQVRSATPYQRVVNPPNLKKLTEDSIMLVCKVFFTKETIKLIDQGKIDKSRFLCYLNPKSMVLDFAVPLHQEDSLYTIEKGLDGFVLDYSLSQQTRMWIDFMKKYRPDIVFTTGCALWDGYVLFLKDGKIQTLNLATGIMEPVSENNTYVKENLNTSLGVMTKPGKIVICY